MENKENDLLLTMTSNPQFSLGNLKDMGLNVENTSLASKETYESLKEIQDIFKKDDGSFNQEKFDKFYDYAVAFYNDLANDEFDLENAKLTSVDKYDIYASPEEREISPNIDIVRVFNPDRQRKGTINLWRTEAPTMSRDEIAQTQKILLNPVKSEKGEEQIWGNTPNDSFFKDFFKTRVLAAWDEDGTHIDPFYGVQVEHKKGEFKLNQEGTYYYEDLDGRDIYGKQVLNKLNVITKDGSKLNKYDIFDSDDLNQKSATKTLLKNVALVGSMWIPYVGWGIAAASIGSQLAGVGATFAKMISGSDNPTLSAIEGWSKSVSRQGARSQYAQENTWCWENFINTIGDVVGQLKEQRFLFEKFPALIKGKGGLNPKKLEAEYLAEETKALSPKIQELIDKADPKFYSRINELNGLAKFRAADKAKAYMDSYQNIGRIVSQAYMTAITVQDAYGEAKLNGASDLEAAALMLGYTAGEYMIINSELGRWILPETRADRYRNVAIAEALTNARTIDTATKEGKKSFVKKLFDYGKKIATSDYANGTKTIKATLASGLGEGFEEVSEEFLQDASYSLFNLSRWLRGDETVMTPWQNMADRYGMSFVGGFFGGGITNLTTNYQQIKSYKGMDFDKATQELVYMVRNGEIGDFMKSLDKIELGNKRLSASKYTEHEDGSIVWDPGTKEDNQDKALKDAIRQQVSDIQQIINSNGLNISDDSFLKGQTDIIKDLKLTSLQNSATAGRFLQEFNTVTQQIVSVSQRIKDLATEAQNDQGKTVNENANLELANERKKLTDLLKQKDDLLQGKRSPEFIRDAIVELSPILQMAPVTFYMYAEKKSGKKYEEIPENELKQYAEEYDKYQNGELKDDVHLQAEVLELFLHKLTDTFNTHQQLFEEQLKNTTFTDLKNQLLQILEVSEQNNNPEEELQLFQTSYNLKNINLLGLLIRTFGSESDVTQLDSDLQNIANEQDESVQNELVVEFLNKYSEVFTQNISKLVDPVLKEGYLNSEEKVQLLDLIDQSMGIISGIALKLEDENETGFASVDTTYLWDYIKTLEDYKNQINKLHHTPIEEFLNNFSVQVTGKPFDITKLITEVNKQLELFKDDLSQFQIDNELEASITQGLQLLNFYEMAVEASRTDNGDIDNLFGFSLVLNEANRAAGTEGYIPLAELSGQMANVLTQDINALKNTLLYAQRLFALNQGQKFLQQDKISLNKNYITYNALLAFTKALSIESDKWKGLDKLISVLDEQKIHKANYQKKNLNLSQEEKNEIEKESIYIENALFDFINENINSLKSKEERVNKWKELLNPKNINFYFNSGQLLTTVTEQLDPSVLVWYLVSRSAVKSSNFYGKFREIISDQIAPLPAQISNIYLNYSFITNGDIFSEAQEALNSIIREDWKDKSVQEREEILEKNKKDKNLAGDEYADLVLNFGLTPNFRNIVLTDGIPGSGKTRAVIDYTIRMLKQFNPEILRDILIVNTADRNNPDTSATASDLGNKLGLNSFRSFSHDAFLNYAFANNKHFEQDPDTGEYNITDSDWQIDPDTKELNSTFEVIQQDKVPSLIIIDEISKYNYFQLKAIDNFAKKYGITVLAAGDFNQDGAIGSHSLSYNGLNFTNQIELTRSNFVHSQKLGFSMRSLVSQMSQAIKSLQSYIENPETDFPQFRYAEITEGEDKGLYGVKVSMKDSDGNIRNIDDVMKTIDLMISKLEPGEKIGYIYNKDTQLTKLLSEDKYKDIIEFYKGSSAQGLEGKYYVVDMDINDESIIPSEAEKKFLRQLYTAISRSELGTLLVVSEDNFRDVYDFPHLGTIPQSKRDSKVTMETYSKEAIAAQSKRWIDRLNSFDFLTTDSDSHGRTKDDGIPTTVKVNENKPDDVVPEPERRQQIDKLSQSDDIPPTTDEGFFNLLLFSFNTYNDSGFYVDEKGMLKPRRKSQFDARIDGLNGLLKLKSDLTEEECNKIIGRLRSIIFNTKDKAELNKKVTNLLKRHKLIDSEVNTEFGIKSGLVLDDNDPNYNPAYEMYDHFIDEEIKYNHSEVDPETTRAKEEIRKQLIMRIGIGKDAILEIPIFTLMNPKTIISSKQGGKPLYPELINYWNSLPKRLNFYEKCQEIINKFGTDPQYKDIINMFELFIYTKRNYFVIDDKSWTPSKNLINYGIQYTSGKGIDNYEVEGFKYEGKWERFDEFLSYFDPSLNRTDVLIYDAQANDPKINVQKGRPFILVSDDNTLTQDGIVNAFINGSEHVHLVYLSPPQASIKSFLYNLKDKIRRGNTTEVRDIGNELTAYRLLKVLLANDEFVNKFKEGFGEEYLNQAIEAVNSISELENQGYTSTDLLSKVREQKTWVVPGGSTKPKSADYFLNGVLINFARGPKNFTANQNTSDDFELIDDNIGLVERILLDNKINYIAYSVVLSKDKQQRQYVGGIFAKVSDDNTISVRPEDNGNFWINGKIDSPVFGGDMRLIIDKVVKNIKQKNSQSDPNYTNHLMSDVKSRSKQVEDALNALQRILPTESIDYTDDITDDEIIKDIISKINDSGKALAFNIKGIGLHILENDTIFNGKGNLTFGLEENGEYNSEIPPIKFNSSTGEGIMYMKIADNTYLVTITNDQVEFNSLTEPKIPILSIDIATQISKLDVLPSMLKKKIEGMIANNDVQQLEKLLKQSKPLRELLKNNKDKLTFNVDELLNSVEDNNIQSCAGIIIKF